MTDVLVFVTYVAFLALGIVAGQHNALSTIALCLSLGCAVLWFIARRQLGDAFSVRPEARFLVTSGLYSKIRHPIYVFGTMAFLFVVLALQGWGALSIWVIVVGVQIIRARREEKVMAATFGEEYAAYRSRTWF